MTSRSTPESPSSALPVGSVTDSWQSLLLACGVVGPILFFAVLTIAGAVRPGYSAVHDFVADLSLGDQGWVQIANFILFGVLMLAFAVGARSALRSGPTAMAGPLLIGTFGVGLLLGGIFLPDPGPRPRRSTGSCTA